MKKGNKFFELFINVVGFIIFLYTFKIIIEKVEVAIIKGENPLTISLLFNINEIIILSTLSILFLYLVYANNKKQFFSYIPKFLSWIIYIFISASLIYILLLIPHFTETFNLIVVFVFFSLFILYKRLKE